MCNVGTKFGHWTQSQWAWLMANISRLAMWFVVAAYAVIVLVAAFCLLPAGPEQAQVSAARYLGANTRMANGLWVEPGKTSWGRRMVLERLEEELSGKYIKHPVDTGHEITPDNVTSWPTMPDEDIVPVPLETEPDWMTLNQGSMVEVWLGDKLATRQPALVEAIVGAGAQWTALLRRSDFSADALKNWADKPKLRLIRLPRKPQWSPT